MMSWTTLVIITSICIFWKLHLAECVAPRNGIFILHLTDHDDGSVLVKVKWSNNIHEEEGSASCQVMPDKYENIPGTLENMTVKNPTQEEMDTFLDICANLPRTDHNDHPHSLSVEVSDEQENNTAMELGVSEVFSFPGTKWCGPGNIASFYDDLGVFDKTDKCCREHDHCDEFILSGETKYNLTNKSDYTRMSCECDNEFLECLKGVNSHTSKTVKYLFFKLLNRLCFALDFPDTGKCLKYKTFLRLICTKRKKDSNQLKAYNWITAKQFRKMNSTEIGKEPREIQTSNSLSVAESRT